MRNRLADRATRRVGASTRISSHRRIHVRIPHVWWHQAPVDPRTLRRRPTGTPRARRRLVLVHDGQPRAGAAAARAGGCRADVADHRRRASRGCGRRSALLDAEPTLRVVVLEADRVGWGASGRNGGFCAAIADPRPAQRDPPLPGRDRRPRARGRRATCASSCAFVRNEGIDCELEETGTLDVATEPWQVEGLRGVRDARGPHGDDAHVPRPRRRSRREVHSPRFLAGVRAGPERCVMVNPAKLAVGTRDGGRAAGRHDPEGSRVTPARAPRRRGRRPRSTAARGSRRTRCSSATSAYSGWMRRLVPLFVPVYDYVLMTEPLTAGAAGRRSAGAAARACPTRATSSTTSG